MNNIDKLKNAMLNGMIHNFENDGYLTPIVFFLENGMPIISEIPSEFMSTIEGKQQLSEQIKSKCANPNVIVGGIITEAYCSVITDDEMTDDEMGDLLKSGDISVKEMKDKKDIIMMIFSTPEKQETFVYVVDVDNKKIIKKLDNSDNVSGLFSGFFNWINN